MSNTFPIILVRFCSSTYNIRIEFTIICTYVLVIAYFNNVGNIFFELQYLVHQFLTVYHHVAVEASSLFHIYNNLVLPT